MLRGIDSQGDSLEKPFNGLRTMKKSQEFSAYIAFKDFKKILLTLCIGFSEIFLSLLEDFLRRVLSYERKSEFRMMFRGIDIQGDGLEKPSMVFEL
ncbi:hypothetical protein CEXT_135521 [Caerostris extrusa]|uniref:Uncharacterized protein n=1 Tax=Caerostris extrusa TaxID=172846 RepID=A0AAV4XS60_CAEEX|nr:hypothetical protein CEXT_135521 [Caerostris extrusa]